MSQDLKAFYDFQGQENFDIGEIQSKMSSELFKINFIYKFIIFECFIF